MKIGVTGHQDIGSDETIEWVKVSLEKLILENSIDLGLTCLARGADQIYAGILQENGIPYIAIIASKDYYKTFTDVSSLNTYQRLLKGASEIRVLHHDNASEQAFYEAGELLIHKSDLIIAVWNGKPAKGLGGTADIVQYAIKNQKKVIHINTTSHQISNLDPM